MEKGSLAEREISRQNLKQHLRDSVIEGEAVAGDSNTVNGRKPSIAVFFTVLVCIGLFAFGVYYYVDHNVVYSYDVDWEREIVSDSQVTGAGDYVAFGGGIVRYSRDGAEYISQDGESIWERSYQMSSPIADSNDDYIVIADQGHTKMYILSSAGLIGQTDTLHPISKVTIADSGVVYAILNDTDADYITAYRSDGSALDLSVKSLISGDGYPFDVDVSPDGTQLLTSYVTVENEEIVNNVVFRNFGEVGINTDANRVVGGFSDEFEGHLAGTVHFSTDEYSQAFYDGGVVFFSTRVLNSPQVLENVSFTSDILSVGYNDRLVSVLLEGSDGENTLMIYSLEGKNLAEISVDSASNNMCVSANRVILFSEDHISVYGRNGNLHADISADSAKISKISASGTNRAFYIVSGSSLSRVTI